LLLIASELKIASPPARIGFFGNNHLASHGLRGIAGAPRQKDGSRLRLRCVAYMGAGQQELTEQGCSQTRRQELPRPQQQDR